MIRLLSKAAQRLGTVVGRPTDGPVVNVLNVSEAGIGDIGFVELEGVIDRDRCDELRRALTEVARRPRVSTIVIDMARVDDIDSAGLATLLECRESIVAHGGRIVLAWLGPQVEARLELSRLDEAFEIAGPPARPRRWRRSTTARWKRPAARA